jgi:hypothetical protein
MAEQAFDVNSLSEEQRKILLGQLQGGQEMPQMFDQKDRGFLGNIMQRKILNPLQVRLGLKDSPQDILRQQQSFLNQYELQDMQQGRKRRDALAKTLIENYGFKKSQVENLSADALEDIVLGRQGEVEFDNYGNPTQTNLMTGEVSSPYQLSSELQQYNRSMGQRENTLNTAQQALNQLPPGSPPYALPPGPVSLEAFRRQQKQADSDRESAATRNTKIDERAITRIDGITTPIYNGMSDIGSQRASLNQLSSLIEAGAQTGFAQGFLAEARNLGIDLGLNVADPTPELVFGAISNRIALPLVKSLGSNPTDTDLQLILDSAPGLSKTPEGNKILIDTIKLKLDRQELIAKALMAFEDANRDLFRSDPLAYRQQLDRMILEIQNSEDFKKKSVFEMKARLGVLQNREPKSNNIISNL